jgi:1,4-alpha-glucan branching enzyme
MKTILSSCLLLALPLLGAAQILTTDPPFPTQTDDITITYNAASGNGELANAIPLYAHTGIVVQADVDNCVNNWQYVKGPDNVWGTANSSLLLSPQGNNIHTITINPSTFYDEMPSGTDVARLMFVFRNANGSLVGRNANGSDIYLDLYEPGFHAGILQPFEQVINANVNENIPLHCAASSPATLTLTINGEIVATAENATVLDYTFNEATNGGYDIVLTADDGTNSASETILININPQPASLAAPVGTQDGINIIDNTTVRLQLHAPNKDFVYVLGDFNNWQFNAAYLMNRTPDGSKYWLDITGLDPNTTYAFQYSIDLEDMRVADPYTEMVLDPWNDQWIPASTFPNIPTYPRCSTSQIASTFRINQAAFDWNDDSYVRPPAERLVVYELLVRDFTEARNYQTLIDTLDYLDRLGVTAIELMPINEFEGNDSWGYNTSFFFALDKAYGSKESFKAFVNACHERGIAVLMDIVVNHAFGQNPMVRMYFNPDAGDYGQPTAENPWFNETPRHDFNVGYDFNHESALTRNFFKRMMRYWIDEYHVDGYRFDLSKGLTQNYTLGNIGAWGAYDQSRVNILTEYYNDIQSHEPGAYVILEHLADNSEETALANIGMMLWGKMTTEYEQASMGYSSNSNLTWGVYTSRGWSQPRLVSYAESHDEERMMYKNINFGNSSGSYDIQNVNTALQRQEMAHALLIPIPGPKMIWQFGELGYDYSINYCSDGTINEDCRTYAKPVRWDYRDIPQRYRVYKVVSALNQIKKSNPIFSTTDFDIDLVGMGKRLHLNTPDLKATVVGNFNVIPINMIPGFQHTGTWYDYLSGNTVEVSDLNFSFNYAPGEYHVYFDQPIFAEDTAMNVEDAMQVFGLDFMVYPNPAGEQVTIGFRNDHHQKVQIDILDLSGKCIETISNQSLSVGIQTIDWNAAGVARGMYMVRVTNGQQSITRPLILSE